MALKISEVNGQLLIEGTLNSVTAGFIKKHLQSLHRTDFSIRKDHTQITDNNEIKRLQELGYQASLL